MRYNYIIKGSIDADSEDDALDKLAYSYEDINSIEVGTLTAYYDYKGTESKVKATID